MHDVDVGVVIEFHHFSGHRYHFYQFGDHFNIFADFPNFSDFLDPDFDLTKILIKKIAIFFHHHIWSIQIPSTWPVMHI